MTSRSSLLRQPAHALAALATSLGLLAAAAPAQAAIYVGTFDPAFGGNFTGLGWRGEVVFDVADACLALGNATAANVECQSTQVQSAFVALYNLNDPSNFEVLDFFGAQVKLSIYDITIAGGAVTGISTILMAPPFGPSNVASPGDWLLPAGTLDPTDVVDWYDQYRYGLSIDGASASLAAVSTSVGPGPGDPVDLLPGQCPWRFEYAICYSETSPTVTFTPLPPSQVPEPATLALVGLALAGAGLARRRAG